MCVCVFAVGIITTHEVFWMVKSSWLFVEAKSFEFALREGRERCRDALRSVFLVKLVWSGC